MLITKRFHFHAAHNLVNYYGKCERVHGHTYHLDVVIDGPVASNGMVIDFYVLKRIVMKHVIDVLDHQYLNEIISNPSAEQIAIWIWDKLENLPKLMQEELDDPNMAEEVKKFFAKQDQPSTQETSAEKETAQVGLIRLHEVTLWETERDSVTYRGK